MANNNFSLNTVLKLSSKEFKRGVAEVKNSLRGLQTSFRNFAASLGAGLGLYQLIGSFKRVAVELNTAKAVLKNVSIGFNEAGVAIDNYESNLQYCINLSEKYKQTQTSVISTFAQFSGAAKGANMALSTQKEIFESLIRVSAFYHLTSQQTQNVMLAFTQMLSKGRVNSEELRRQAGQYIPGIVNIMADAIGVGVDKMEDLMKAGKVLSTDALPKLAKKLNEITGSFEESGALDSLQLKMNELTDSFTKLVGSSGFENFYLGLINTSIKALDTIREHFKSLVTYIVTAGATIGSIKLFQNLRESGMQTFKALENEYKVLERTLSYGKKEVSRGIVNSKIMSIGRDDRGVLNYRSVVNLYKEGGNEEALRANAKLIDQYLRMNEIKKKVGEKPILTDYEVKRYQTVLQTTKRMKVELGELKSSASVWKQMGQGLANFGKSLAAFAKANALVFIFSAIAGYIANAVASTIEWNKRLREARELSSKLNEEYDKLNNHKSPQERRLEALMENLKGAKPDGDGYKNTLKEIAQIIGLSDSALKQVSGSYDDILQKVTEWIAKQKKLNELQLISNKQIDIASKMTDAKADYEKLRVEYQEKYGNDWSEDIFRFKGNVTPPSARKTLFNRIEEAYRTYGGFEKEMRRMEGRERELLKEVTYTPNNDFATNVEGDGEDTPREKRIKSITDAIKKYQDEVKELKIKLEENEITQDEYDKKILEAARAPYILVRAYGELTDALEGVDEASKKVFGEQITPNYKGFVDALQLKDVSDLISNYKSEYDKLNNQLTGGTISNEQYADSLREVRTEFYKNLTAIDGYADKVKKLGAESIANEGKQGFNETAAIRLAEYQNGTKPELKQRDKSLDYGKKKSQILEEEAANIDDYINQVKQRINEAEAAVKDGVAEAGEELNKLKPELEALMKVTPELKVKINIAKTIEDIDSLEKRLRKGIGSGVQNLANDLDRCVRGITNLKQIFENADSTAWEKFMAIFNELTSVIETLTSTMNAYKAIEETLVQLQAARAALTKKQATEEGKALVENVTAKSADVIATEALAAAEGESAIATAANAAAKEGEAASVGKSSSAKFLDAIATVASNPLALIAIGAAMAGIIALISSAKNKFANGGIVGGSSYSGDKVLARVNSGEMILNTGQQRRLFNMLNGKSPASSGGEVKFEIDGTKLVGVLNNYNRKRKGK